jgi:hypothetical protein
MSSSPGGDPGLAGNPYQANPGDTWLGPTQCPAKSIPASKSEPGLNRPFCLSNSKESSHGVQVCTNQATCSVGTAFRMHHGQMSDNSPCLMYIDKLIRQKANISEQFRRPILKLLEKDQNPFAQTSQIIRWSMQMQDLLSELAPEFLDRIEPGGIGGQHDHLHGQVPGSIPFDGGRAGCKRPIVRPRKGEWTVLRFQSNKHIRMKVNRPMVLNDPNAFCLRGSVADVLIEFDELPSYRLWNRKALEPLPSERSALPPGEWCYWTGTIAQLALARRWEHRREQSVGCRSEEHSSRESSTCWPALWRTCCFRWSMYSRLAC